MRISLFSIRYIPQHSGVPRNFVRWRGRGGGGGVQEIQLSTEDRKNGDLGAVAP